MGSLFYFLLRCASRICWWGSGCGCPTPIYATTPLEVTNKKYFRDDKQFYWNPYPTLNKRVRKLSLDDYYLHLVSGLENLSPPEQGHTNVPMTVVAMHPIVAKLLAEVNTSIRGGCTLAMQASIIAVVDPGLAPLGPSLDVTPCIQDNSAKVRPISAASDSTMRRTRSSRGVLAVQPNLALALEESPCRGAVLRLAL